MKEVSICRSLRPLREKVAEGRMRGAVVGQALPDNAPQGHLPGFTLIELLVVVIIIAILAAIAVPQYQLAVGKSRVVRVLPMLRSILNAQDLYYLANGTYTNDMDELDVNITYISKGEEIEAGWGPERKYTLENGQLQLYQNKHAIVWTGEKLVINLYGTDSEYAHCYSHDTLGAKICKTLGTPIKTKEDGSILYLIKF